MSEESRYVLAKKIARGGMAEIYLGKHVGDDGFQRICAIKRILPHYTQDQEFIQMFRDEAHICKRLQHANIVRVEGFEEVEGSYAIIMEFVDGSDLRTLLHSAETAKKKLPIAMACHIIAESARGLHFAHTKVDEITSKMLGIVHRDISPQNILVSYEGEVKATDFGIADADNKLTETRPGIVKGKYSYMSPEQISAKDVDARTDVFALAIVLWEMVAMRRLFQGDNEVDTIQRVKNCRIDHDLMQLNPECDPELDEIIKKGLAKDLKKRHKSAGDLEKDLRKFMSRKYPEFTPEELGNFLKQNMETRRSESLAEIKKTLTETTNRPAASARKAAAALRKPGVDIVVEDNPSGQQPQLSIAGRSNPHATGAGMSGMNQGGGMTGMTGMTNNGPRSGNTNAGLRGATNASRPMSRPATNASNVMPTEPRSSGGKAWLFMIVAAVALVVGTFAYKQNAKGKTTSISLRAQPSRVRVSVDNKPINQGRYVRAATNAPLKLTLKPGKHTVVVSREGYHSYKYTFDADAGDRLSKDDIVLKEKGTLAAVKVRMRQIDKTVKIDIDDGYFVATITPGKVDAVAPDVLADKTYSLRASVAGEKDFTCKFQAKSTSWRTPNEVVVDRRSKSCKVTGP